MKLASQGFLEGALTCLSGLQDQDLVFRLQCALGYAQPYQASNAQPQRSAAVQNHYTSGNRVRTSSYKSATQQQDSWGAVSQPHTYTTNTANQNTLYNSGSILLL